MQDQNMSTNNNTSCQCSKGKEDSKGIGAKKGLNKKQNKNMPSLDSGFGESGFEIFSLELMGIIERDTTSTAIWWSQCGSFFTINKQNFESSVLSKDYKGIKLGSFLRRLRRWEFERMPNKNGPDSNFIEYRHPLFRKNSQHLLKNWDPCEDNLSAEDKLPVKLLNALDCGQVSDAIWWTYDGKAFAIEKNSFTSSVLRKYFDGITLEQFYRKLRRWGFKRLSHQEKCAKQITVFQHAMFQKGSPLSKRLLEEWANTEGLPEEGTSNQAWQKKEVSFPKKLYGILNSGEAPDAIWWLESGDAFAIHTIRLSRDVLPSEFKEIKICSFQRKMKRWGFQKFRTGLTPQNVLTFQHPLFRKDAPDLLNKWHSNFGSPHDQLKSIIRCKQSKVSVVKEAKRAEATKCAGKQLNTSHIEEGLTSHPTLRTIRQSHGCDADILHKKHQNKLNLSDLRADWELSAHSTVAYRGALHALNHEFTRSSEPQIGVSTGFPQNKQTFLPTDVNRYFNPLLLNQAYISMLQANQGVYNQYQMNQSILMLSNLLPFTQENNAFDLSSITSSIKRTRDISCNNFGERSKKQKVMETF